MRRQLETPVVTPSLAMGSRGKMDRTVITVTQGSQVLARVSIPERRGVARGKELTKAIAALARYATAEQVRGFYTTYVGEQNGKS